MQKPIWTNLMIFVFTVSLFSCDNELNVAADWEEVAVVYGALNPTHEKNYIRVQRAYLDESRGALTFSQNQDSLYFSDLDVQIDEFENSSFKTTYTLTRVDGNTIGIPKDTGVFYSEKNILYELSDPIRPSESTKEIEYRLRVKNPVTGYTCTSMALSVGKPEVRNPVTENAVSLRILAAEGHTIPVIFQEGRGVRSYTVVMDFRVEERSKSDTTKKEIKDLQWRMINSGKTSRIEGFEEAKYLVPSVGFFSYLGGVLQENPLVERRLVDFDLKFYGISDEFNTFLDVNKPSIGIVQKKPEYTNVENGLGLFTIRHIKEFNGLPFHSSMVGQINVSDLTKNLGFVQ